MQREGAEYFSRTLNYLIYKSIVPLLPGRRGEDVGEGAS